MYTSQVILLTFIIGIILNSLSNLPSTVFAAMQSLPEQVSNAFQCTPPLTSTLYYKSAQGLMPPAYVLDPDAPAELSISALSIPFLNPYTTQPVGSWPQVIAAADLTGGGQQRIEKGTDSGGRRLAPVAQVFEPIAHCFSRASV
ncbi:MAG: hypothetical protein H6631_03585 [Anaerolineaceae bacterium]|nr:hypothetical protein [Anaerolineaceae bacterium]MCB9102003.1 hypothetical protein [Anaerolineales bacterium]